MELEITNKLYLELSQFATAKTAKELELENMIKVIIMAWNEDGVTEKNQRLYNRMAYKFGILKVGE